VCLGLRPPEAHFPPLLKSANVIAYVIIFFRMKRLAAIPCLLYSAAVNITCELIMTFQMPELELVCL